MSTSEAVLKLRQLGVEAYKRGGFVRIRKQAERTFTISRADACEYVSKLLGRPVCHDVLTFHRFQRGES